MTDGPLDPSSPLDSSSPQSTTDVNNEKSIAALVHASGILLSFIVPLVVWLIKKDDSPYLARNSAEALNFQITVLIAYIACMVLTVVLIGMLLLPLVWLFNLVFCIVAAVKTSNGEDYRYPMTIRLIK